MTLGGLPTTARLGFLARKWAYLARLASGSPTHLRTGAADLEVTSVSDVGTLQSCLVDIHDQLVKTRLPGERPFVLDVGANIGQRTSCCKWFYPEATIMAVEPDPTTYARLERAVAPLAGVDARQTAVGRHCGLVTLYRQALSTMSAMCPTGDDSRNPRSKCPSRRSARSWPMSRTSTS